MYRGYVLNWRKIEEWQWYTKPNMAHLFQHLVRKANHEQQKWQGITIERGQLITSIESLSKQTGLSIRSIRTCLDKMKQTNDIMVKSTNKFTMISICKYSTYQNPESYNDKQTTIKRQTSDKQTTTNNNVEECRINVQGGKNLKNQYKLQLLPIFGKNCERCKLPAVYKDSSGSYDHYYCREHMPEEVKLHYA